MVLRIHGMDEVGVRFPVGPQKCKRPGRERLISVRALLVALGDEFDPSLAGVRAVKSAAVTRGRGDAGLGVRGDSPHVPLEDPFLAGPVLDFDAGDDDMST